MIHPLPIPIPIPIPIPPYLEHLGARLQTLLLQLGHEGGQDPALLPEPSQVGLKPLQDLTFFLLQPPQQQPLLLLQQLVKLLKLPGDAFPPQSHLPLPGWDGKKVPVSNRDLLGSP